MRLLADMHISPETVAFLRPRGYDIVRVSDLLPSTASDEALIATALQDGRAILTQDLDFSALVALSQTSKPSVVTLRLASSRVEHVNGILEHALPLKARDAENGALITVEEHMIRRRFLPLA